MHPATIECNDEDEMEDYLPTAPLNDEVWSKEQKPERNLCVHMTPGKSEASYRSTTYPQECIPEQAATYP